MYVSPPTSFGNKCECRAIIKPFDVMEVVEILLFLISENLAALATCGVDEVDVVRILLAVNVLQQ